MIFNSILPNNLSRSQSFKTRSYINTFSKQLSSFQQIRNFPALVLPTVIMQKHFIISHQQRLIIDEIDTFPLHIFPAIISQHYLFTSPTTIFQTTSDFRTGVGWVPLDDAKAELPLRFSGPSGFLRIWFTQAIVFWMRNHEFQDSVIEKLVGHNLFS